MQTAFPALRRLSTWWIVAQPVDHAAHYLLGDRFCLPRFLRAKVGHRDAFGMRRKHPARVNSLSCLDKSVRAARCLKI
jgi:hypothetical protein